MKCDKGLMIPNSFLKDCLRVGDAGRAVDLSTRLCRMCSACHLRNKTNIMTLQFALLLLIKTFTILKIVMYQLPHSISYYYYIA